MKCLICNLDNAPNTFSPFKTARFCDHCWNLLNSLPKDIFRKDPVNDVAQQQHYTQWRIQPITFITANKLNFCQGNVIKYVMRYQAKNGLEDLKKAKVYIDYLIQEIETGEVKP